MTEEKNIKKHDAVQAIVAAWGPLTKEEETSLASQIEIRRYKKNDLIYSDNALPTHMMCILSGKAKIYKDGVGEKRRQILRITKPIEFFAFRAFFAHERYQTSCIAFEPATIALIPLPFVETLAAKNPHVAMFILRHLATILGRSDERIVNLTQKHIRGRLAESLLMLQEEYGHEEESDNVCLRLSREDLACFSNMTTSNAIRTLSAFAAEGLVTINGRNITLKDIATLEKISKQG